ncbi:MAG: hypothetical protein KDA96_21850 [Planctomycetaceae bacterium]|nr:hypothetical protein [Planctomycetaceae bacterium]
MMALRTPTQAMLWELWRTTALQLLLRIGMGCCLPVLIFAIGRFTNGGPESVVITGITVMLLSVCSLAAQSWIVQLDRSQSGFSFNHNFARPVSTVSLVVVPMVFTIATSAACYLLPGLLFSLLTRLPFPFVGPLMLISCAVACFMSATWATSSLAGRIAAVLSVITAMAILAALSMRGLDEPWMMAIGRCETFQFHWSVHVTLLAITAAAFAVSVLSVERQRHGEAWSVPGWRTLRGVLPQSVPIRNASVPSTVVLSGRDLRSPFSGPAAAQFWYEFRRFGRRTLWVSLLAPAAVVAVTLAGLALHYNRRGVDHVWMLALLFCPVVYQLIGIDGAVGLRAVRGVLYLPVFDATRSLSSDRQVEMKLIVVAAGSITGALTMAAAAAVSTFLYGDPGYWMTSFETIAAFFNGVPGWWLLLGSGIALTQTGTTSVFLAGWLWAPLHPRACNWLSMTVVAHIFLAAWDGKRGWVYLPLWQTYGYLLPVVIAAICLLILGTAFSRGVLQTRLFAVGATVWAIHVGSTVLTATTITLPDSITIPPQAYFAAIALLLTPLASVAAAPLALDQHRHR